MNQTEQISFEIANEGNSDCALAADLNGMYRAGSPEQVVQVPPDMGEGNWWRLRTSAAVDLVVSDVRFRERTTMSSKEQSDRISIGFCLGERIRWRIEDRAGEFGLDPGAVRTFGGTYASSHCTYESGHRFRGLSVNAEFKLKKGFKLLYGLPVHAYVLDRRVEAACQLLEQGGMNITEAAYAAGFGKAGHFSAQFKRKYGVTPSEYFRRRPR